jgi:hypothetical protein
VTSRKRVSTAFLDAPPSYGRFMSFALREFQNKYGALPRPTRLERDAVLALVKEHGADKLQAAWTRLLNDRTGLSPKITIRPFSELIGVFANRQAHNACVDGRAHIPPAVYSVWNWAYYALSKQGTTQCWLSSRITARWCCQSKTSANRTIQWLVSHGWLEEIGKPTTGPYGRGGTYKVIGHDKWVARRGFGYSPEPGETCVMENEATK